MIKSSRNIKVRDKTFNQSVSKSVESYQFVAALVQKPLKLPNKQLNEWWPSLFHYVQYIVNLIIQDLGLDFVNLQFWLSQVNIVSVSSLLH